MPDGYIFPQINTNNDLFTQYVKIIEEVHEVGVELSAGDYIKAHEETIDIMQACETFCHLLAKISNCNHERLLQDVIRKNSRRDYYDNR